MTADRELDAWRSQWNAQPAEMPDLSARVRRQSRNMRLMLALEMLVTIVIGGGTTVLAVRGGELDLVALAGATWAFIAAAWSFALWNRKGSWRPAALTVSAFLEVSIRRSRSAIRATAFGMWLYAVEMVFCVGWIWRHEGDASFLRSTPMLGVWVATLVFFVWAVRYGKRQRGELLRLQETAEALGDRLAL